MSFFKVSTLCLALTIGLTGCNEQPEKVSAESKDEGQYEVVSNAYIEDETADLPYFSAMQNATIKSKIVEINRETREVTLALENDEQIVLTTAKDGYHIDEIAVGDSVLVDYVRHVTVALVKGGVDQASAVEGLTLARSEDPNSPGVVAIKEQVVVATVEAIDVVENTFKLKGPDGEIKEYVAKNPDNLTRAEVGDKVVFTDTEAMMLAVKVRPGS